MKTETVYFRMSSDAVAKIAAEAESQGVAPGTLIRAIVETEMNEPQGERLELLDRHEILLEATRLLASMVQGTETYLRQYDLDEDAGLLNKLIEAIKHNKLKEQSKGEGK